MSNYFRKPIIQLATLIILAVLLPTPAVRAQSEPTSPSDPKPAPAKSGAWQKTQPNPDLVQKHFDRLGPEDLPRALESVGAPCRRGDIEYLSEYSYYNSHLYYPSRIFRSKYVSTKGKGYVVWEVWKPASEK